MAKRDASGKFVKKSDVLAAVEKTGMYKGYAIEWLREIPEHPDFGLVAEYDNMKGGN